MGSGAARGATNARPNFGLHYAQGVHLSLGVPHGVPDGVPDGVPHGVPQGVPHGGDLLHGILHGIPHGVQHGVPHGGDLLHGVNQSTFTPCVTPLLNNS